MTDTAGKKVDQTEEKEKTSESKDEVSTSSEVKKKRGAVVAEGEVTRFIDFGLGRGLDATLPTPWLSKSSFQVREVKEDNIIGTDEGGCQQSYEREVCSLYNQQTDLKSSVTIPHSPVTIGVDAEQSRSVSTTRRTVGQRVVNRTISFRADFDDAPEPNDDETMEGGTFEERLRKWVDKRKVTEGVHERRGPDATPHDTTPAQTTHHVITDSSPTQIISPVAAAPSPAEKLDKALVEACKKFVYHFHITHYVSAIELGAYEYRVMSEAEFHNRVQAKGSFGVEALAKAAVTETISRRRRKKTSELKKIGLISKNGTVERGTYGEAVVGIQIQPISNLVRQPSLHAALRKALLDYTENQTKSSGKPDTC